MNKEQKTYLIYFLLALSFFFLLCIYAKSNIKDFRKEFINFDLLNENQRIFLNGLSREQIGQMKISYLANKKIPDICKNCDRYEPVDDYIKRNSLEILRMHIKKFFNQKKIKI